MLVAAVELGLHLPQLRQQHLAEGARHDLRRQARDVRRDAVTHEKVGQLVTAITVKLHHKHELDADARSGAASHSRRRA